METILKKVLKIEAIIVVLIAFSSIQVSADTGSQYGIISTKEKISLSIPDKPNSVKEMFLYSAIVEITDTKEDANSKRVYIKTNICEDQHCKNYYQGWIQRNDLYFEKDYSKVTSWSGKKEITVCMGDYCPKIRIEKNGSITQSYLPYCKIIGSQCDPEKYCYHKHDKKENDLCVARGHLFYNGEFFWARISDFDFDVHYLLIKPNVLCPLYDIDIYFSEGKCQQ